MGLSLLSINLNPKSGDNNIKYGIFQSIASHH